MTRIIMKRATEDMLKVTEKAALMGGWKGGRDDDHCQVKDNVGFSSPSLGTGS